MCKQCRREQLEQERTQRSAAEAQVVAAKSQAAALQADVHRLTGLAVTADSTVQDYVTALQVRPVVLGQAHCMAVHHRDDGHEYAVLQHMQAFC